MINSLAVVEFGSHSFVYIVEVTSVQEIYFLLRGWAEKVVLLDLEVWGRDGFVAECFYW